MADFEAVLKVSDLPPGEVAKVEVGTCTPVHGGQRRRQLLRDRATRARTPSCPSMEDRGRPGRRRDVECEYHGSVSSTSPPARW